MTKQVTVNAILRENRSATRDELEQLYLQAVCETTCIDVVKLMSLVELKRLISIRLMEFWIMQCNHNTGFVVNKTAQLVGIEKRTLYNYLKQNGIVQVKQH